MKLKKIPVKSTWVIMMMNVYVSYSFDFCDDKCVCAAGNSNYNNTRSITCSNTTATEFTQYLNDILKSSRSCTASGLLHTAIEEINNHTFSAVSRDNIINVLKLNNDGIGAVFGQPFSVFRFLKELDLSYNEIVSIYDLGSLKYLTTLNLGHNKLQDVNGSIFDKLEKLETLHLDNNRIQRVSADMFSELLHNFKSLDLSYNEIVFVEDFGRLKSVEKIHLGFNKLQFINGSVFLPFEELQYLYLNSNKLEAFSGVFNPKLKGLDLSCNKIACIDDFGTTIALENLDISFNKLDALNATVFSKLPNLLNLNVSNNMIKFVENSTFQTMKRLKNLNLNSNQLEIITKDLFLGLVNLNYLCLGNNRIMLIEPASFLSLTNVILLDLLESETSVDILQNGTFLGLGSLTSLNLTGIGLKAIYLEAFRGMANLTTLDLSNNQLEILQGRTSLHLNGSNLCFQSSSTFEMQNLVNLRLNNNKLTKIEPEAFVGSKSLEILNLSRNNLTYIVANSFAQLHRLRILDLKRNRISLLSPASFSGLGNLEHLVINDNEIEVIPEDAFTNLVRLENLQLGGNLLRSLSFGGFSDVLQLKQLNLSHNNFSKLNEGALRYLRNLETFDLSNNNLLYVSYTHLLLYLPKLHEIGVSGNRWLCEFLIHMLKTLRENGISYFSNQTSRNCTEDNVEGLVCKWAGNKFNTVKDFNFNNVMPILQNVYVSNYSYNVARTADIEPTVLVELSLGFYLLAILLVLILSSFIIIWLWLLIIVYRIYHEPLNAEESAKACSDIQLLNVSTQQLL